MTTCPKCDYQRTAADHAPEWQCPKCGVAYNKVSPQAVAARSNAVRAARAATVQAPQQSASNGKLWLGALMIVAVAAFGVWKVKFKPGHATQSDAIVFDNAKMALDGNNFKAAYDGFSELAAKGNPRAQYYVGYMYQFQWQGGGDKHEASPQLELSWYTKAAEQGDVEAQVALGKMYTGRGITPNQAQSLKWFQAAADQGHPYAETVVGTTYEKGTGYAQSYAQAANWYRKSAEQGEPGGLFQLAGLYASGKGVTQNNADAYALYKLAEQQNARNPGEGGGFWANVAVGKLSKQLSGAEIDEGNSIAANWSPGKAFPF